MAAEYKHFATIAKLAYLDNAQKHFKDLGYYESFLIDIDGAQAHIAANDNRIIVAFRGTEPREWNDIKADLRTFHKNGFHEGFFLEYKKLEKTICSSIKKLKSENSQRKLYIVGHSLGGAIATVASHIIDEDVECVYTFGAPKACTWGTSKKYKSNHIRFVNNNDVVTRVPFWWIGFRHVGSLYYMNFYGNPCNMTMWQRFIDGLRGRWKALKKKVPFDGFYDHNISEYIKYLKDDK